MSEIKKKDLKVLMKKDVHLDVLKKNSTIEEGELGPENKEARDLMDAFITTVKLLTPTTHDDMDENKFSSGIGKDIFGKYAFADVEHKGRTYQVHLRDKETFDVAVEIAQGRAIGLKITPKKKELN